MKKFSRHGLFAGAMLALLAACGMSSAKPKADVAVAGFHKQLDAADFSGIWTSTDESFRQAGRAKFDKLMDAIHRKLGHVLKSTTVNWSVRNFNLKTSVVLVQETQFERGTATETFTYVTSGDNVKLAGYNIQSMDLMTL